MTESLLRQNTPWRMRELSFTDADSPALIDLRYFGDDAAKVTLDADGGSSSSKFKLTLTNGTATHVITPSAADTNDSVATTIGGLLNVINDLGQTKGGDHEGWQARRRNCLDAQSIDSDDFADITETQVGEHWTSFIHQDMSEVEGALASGLGLTAVRLVNYDFARQDSLTGEWRTPKGYVEIGWLDFTVEFASTEPELVILDDSGDIVLSLGDLTTATQKTSTGVFSFEHPLVLQGPVLVGLHCAAAITAITTARINWRMNNR